MNSDEQWRRTFEAQMSRCVPGRADRPKTGKPVVLLKLSWGDHENVPLMLHLPTARRLVVELVHILKHFGDDLARQLAMLNFPAHECPINGAPKVASPCTNRSQIEPSINPAVPSRPIQETDVWQMIQMLRHIQSHDEFLRMIGAPPLPHKKDKRKRKGRGKH